jgi:hypothetical protein
MDNEPPYASSDACGTVLVEFTPHTGDEMLRDGNWVADWSPAEAVAGLRRMKEKRMSMRAMRPSRSPKQPMRCVTWLRAAPLAESSSQSERP